MNGVVVIEKPGPVGGFSQEKGEKGLADKYVSQQTRNSHNSWRGSRVSISVLSRAVKLSKAVRRGVVMREEEGRGSRERESINLPQTRRKVTRSLQNSLSLT